MKSFSASCLVLAVLFALCGPSYQQAPVAKFAARLSTAANLNKDVNSKAKGFATVTVYNDTFAVGFFQITAFIKETNMAHIHLANSTSEGPVAVTAYNFLLDGKPSYISGLFQGSYTFDPSVGDVGTLMAAGNTYFNVHTKRYPAGEIRGQFRPAKLNK